jgi:hypothetical protein
VFLALLSLLSPAAPALTSANSGNEIVFWDSGVDFSVPEEGRYGLEYVGMFGVLPEYLEGQGYSCRIEEQLGEQALAGATVLVVLNPMHTPNPDELITVWKFVENGGRVLAVGDHTGDEQIRLPLNAILQPVGVEFNFDSAVPFKSLWPDNFIQRRSPIFQGVDYPQIQIVVGASLSIDHRARPLLIGKNGFSDLGNMANVENGFLGNMRFDRGEPVGDLILAAEGRYGEGLFLVFGDTTHLQNTVLAHSKIFVDNVFAYLTAGRKPLAEKKDEPDGLYPITCLIDASHLPSFNWDKRTEALDGFIACALRAGVFSEVHYSGRLTYDMFDRSDLKFLVLVEPALAYNAKEIVLIREFVEKGGTLLLFGNYQSPQATWDLFRSFGFSFERMPFGHVAPAQNPEMAFWNACPIYYEEMSLTRHITPGECLLEVWGECVIARRNLGLGQVFAFGDSCFIKNKNLEHVDTYREGNIDFIIDLLRKAVN